MFNIAHAGGPRITSIRALCNATIFRTADITINDWPGDIVLLRRTAEAELPHWHLMQGYYWPKFWDSAPFASNLKYASEGFQGDPLLEPTIPDVLADMAAHEQDKPNKRVKVQAIAYKHFFGALHCSDLQFTLERRILTYAPHTAELLKDFEWPDHFRFLQQHRGQVCSAVWKTYCNSWSTSSRYHDGIIRFCIFGCHNATDALDHYIDCPRLWRSVNKHTRGPKGRSTTDRLALSGPAGNNNVSKLAVAFHTYHAVRLGHFSEIVHAHFARDYRSLARLTQEIASAEAIAVDGDEIITPQDGEKANEHNYAEQDQPEHGRRRDSRRRDLGIGERRRRSPPPPPPPAPENDAEINDTSSAQSSRSNEIFPKSQLGSTGGAAAPAEQAGTGSGSTCFAQTPTCTSPGNSPNRFGLSNQNLRRLIPTPSSRIESTSTLLTENSINCNGGGRLITQTSSEVCADRQTDRQAGRQTDTHVYTYMYMYSLTYLYRKRARERES